MKRHKPNRSSPNRFLSLIHIVLVICNNKKYFEKEAIYSLLYNIFCADLFLGWVGGQIKCYIGTAALLRNLNFVSYIFELEAKKYATVLDIWILYKTFWTVLYFWVGICNVSWKAKWLLTDRLIDRRTEWLLVTAAPFEICTNVKIVID